MERVFLDTNVLFSAAYSDDADFLRLWRLPDIDLIISTYVVEETFRNLSRPDQLERLNRLLADVEIVTEWDHITIPEDVNLPKKDIPIMQAAIAGEAAYLVTGDYRDFGEYFGRVIEGVEVIRPAMYLQRHS